MTELKSCPFCLGKDIEVQSRQYTDTFYWGARCVCNNCGAKSGTTSCEARDKLKMSHEEAEIIAKNSAIEAWNSRPEQDRIEALNAELVADLEEILYYLKPELDGSDDHATARACGASVTREALKKSKGERE